MTVYVIQTCEVPLREQTEEVSFYLNSLAITTDRGQSLADLHIFLRENMRERFIEDANERGPFAEPYEGYVWFYYDDLRQIETEVRITRMPIHEWGTDRMSPIT